MKSWEKITTNNYLYDGDRIIMYYKIGPLLHLISAENEWMSWEKGREKWLYQQWYGVNLLIGVMCVTVPHALICSLYTRAVCDIATVIICELTTTGIRCAYRIWLKELKLEWLTWFCKWCFCHFGYQNSSEKIVTWKRFVTHALSLHRDD